MHEKIKKSSKTQQITIPYERIFLLSDVHFGVRVNSLEWLENHLDFFYNFYIPYLKKNKKDGDILFFLGDWFDNKELIDIKIMNESLRLMSELTNILPVHMITGNHDIYKKIDTDINSLAVFKNMKNLYIYEDPIIISNTKSKILVLPWIGNKEEEEKIVKSNKNIDYIFAHTVISGFVYDNGRKIEKAGAKIGNLKHIKKLFSGHIHKRQEDRNAIYVGSPYHTKRSDIGNQKAVYLFNPNNNTYEYEYNNHSPIYQKIKLETLLELTLHEIKNILDNNYTDILVSDEHIQKFSLNTFISLLQGCNYKKIEVHGSTGKLDTNLGIEVTENEIVDIITLIEIGIKEKESNPETLKILLAKNKEYYNKAFQDEELL